MMIAMMMTTMVVVMDVFWFWFELWFPHVLKVAFLVSLMRSCRGLTVIQKQAAEDKSTFSWVLTIGTKAFSVNFDFKIGCENINFWNLISCWAFFSLIMANIPRPSKVNKQPTYPTLRGAQIGWTFGEINTFLILYLIRFWWWWWWCLIWFRWVDFSWLAWLIRHPYLLCTIECKIVEVKN